MTPVSLFTAIDMMCTPFEGALHQQLVSPPLLTLFLAGADDANAFGGGSTQAFGNIFSAFLPKDSRRPLEAAKSPLQ